MGASPLDKDAAKKESSSSPKTTSKKSPVTTEPAKAEALGPPPRPAVTESSNTNEFFPQPSTSHLSSEPNPFESSFAGNGTDTPGGTKLPSVAALTSPAPLLGASTPGFNWGSSLRTGPLSPAMLSGPTSDYFSESHHLGRTGFTPNESSLRTGLTPGGGGSMFPAPSPNSQALFNQLASGGATPSTLDFHRTALSAAAQQKRAEPSQNFTSQPHELINGVDMKPAPAAAATEGFGGQHDANDAANGLFMLASQSRNSSQGANQYAMAQQQPVHSVHNSKNSMDMSTGRPNGSTSTASGRGVSEISDDSDHAGPKTRGKGRKGAQSNGRRKADDTPAKGPASKKAKANSGIAHSYMEPEPPSEDEVDMNKDEYNANGKKMTDEEKRKNFLERNRVAALKCRQRKKQWLANLQHKVEIFSSENDALSSQISILREEVVNLKTLLLAHKDCPVTQQQGINGNYMGQIMADYGNQMQNPYGMAMQQQQVMAGQGGMQGRRYS